MNQPQQDDRVELVEAFKTLDIAGPPLGGVTQEILGLYASEQDAHSAHTTSDLETRKVIGFRDSHGLCRLPAPPAGEMVIRQGVDTTTPQSVKGAESLPKV